MAFNRAGGTGSRAFSRSDFLRLPGRGFGQGGPALRKAIPAIFSRVFVGMPTRASVAAAFRHVALG